MTFRTVLTMTAISLQFLQAAPAQSATEPSPAIAGAQLQEVIVTAEKRRENLSKVPVAISVLNQGQLAKAGVQTVQQLSTQVPDLEIGNYNLLGNAIVLTIRGITTNYFDFLGDQAIAVYEDGVYIPRTQGLSEDLFDLERVEVLRGPQGTLYGRNTIGGAVNILTAQPRDHFEASGDVSYGNYDDVQVHGMVNIPVSSTLAVRGAFMTHRNNGYYSTDGTTARNYGVADDFGARVTALWHPTDYFSWRLTVENFVDDGTLGMFIALGPDGKPADGRPAFGPHPINPLPEPRLHIDNRSVHSKMDFDLAANLSLAYIAGYQDLPFSWDMGSTNPPLPGQNIDSLGNAFYGRQHNQNYMHELDLTYDGAAFKNTLGGAYFHEHHTDIPTYYLFLIPGALRGTNDPDGIKEAWGVYDQATYDVTNKLSVTGGIRYSHNWLNNPDSTQKFCGAGTIADVLQTYPPATFVDSPLSAPFPGCNIASTAGRGSWAATNWKAAIQYQFTSEDMAYLSATTGFKEGGIDESSPALTYMPEKATDYELGFKTRWLDDRLMLNADAFYENYYDLQVTQIEHLPTGGNGAITTNAAQARIYGLETEESWLMSPDDRVDAFVNYLSAKFTKYNDGLDSLTGDIYPSLSGNYLPKAPEVSLRLRYSHDFELPNGATLTPAADLYFQTVTYLREFNLPVDKVPAYTRTGLTLTYTSGGWQTEAYVNNVEDKAVRNIAYTLNGVYYGIYDDPRTFGIRVSYAYSARP